MAKSIHILTPLDGPEQFINLNHIETLEIYEHTPRKWVEVERSFLGFKVFDFGWPERKLVQDGEPFWAFELTLTSGRVIHMKEDRVFYSTWHNLLK